MSSLYQLPNATEVLPVRVAIPDPGVNNTANYTLTGRKMRLRSFCMGVVNGDAVNSVAYWIEFTNSTLVLCVARVGRCANNTTQIGAAFLNGPTSASPDEGLIQVGCLPDAWFDRDTIVKINKSSVATPVTLQNINFLFDQLP